MVNDSVEPMTVGAIVDGIRREHARLTTAVGELGEEALSVASGLHKPPHRRVALLQNRLVLDPDYDMLRRAVRDGTATLEVSPLAPDAIDEISWSGSRAHLENVAEQLQRVDAGEVVYLVVRADGSPVAKGGIDFAKERGAGTIWQLATHPLLEGIGLATRLIADLEQQAIERGVRRSRLGVEIDNVRARRLYEHLGYRIVGESTASWEAEATDGTRFLYSTTITEMEKVL